LTAEQVTRLIENLLGRTLRREAGDELLYEPQIEAVVVRGNQPLRFRLHRVLAALRASRAASSAQQAGPNPK
jgi:hypothetical protein